MKHSNKPDNDNPLTVKLNIAVPKEHWLDFKNREVVMIWTDGRETRTKINDQKFKEYLEMGLELRNLN